MTLHFVGFINVLYVGSTVIQTTILDRVLKFFVVKSHLHSTTLFSITLQCILTKLNHSSVTMAILTSQVIKQKFLQKLRYF